MAALDFHRGTTAGSLGQVFANAIATLKAWNDDRATRRALSKLSDHELEDIGLIRGDIDQLRYSGLIR
ncbi:DUF1127 domain-containing protein [Pseudaestuariivita atlantica]|uniref:YjiS-like domain-containing protein n=1 Tax=Pseudaestuariivita atlantica TaxID=1317121 RepID=A0A0L1JTN7_9RHOB|nr:DUF1127 domain-containing protein [Pseudaestuariivita atlantica]KNG94778.1 hypothetical protein ATO11_05145 [Pseudaestuariivita atlantica]